MMEPKAAEEDTMHIMHDIPLRESQMEAHIESMMDMQLTLGSTTEEEQSICTDTKHSDNSCRSISSVLRFCVFGVALVVL